MGPPGSPPFPVALTSSPAVIVPGQPVRLRFAITHPKTGSPVTDLAIVHDMPFHLFILAEDLSTYDHIHPTVGDDGAFVVDTTFPKAGVYHVYCDFLPVGGTPQVVHLHLATAGASPDRKGPPVKLAPDTVFEKTVDGIRFALTFEPPRIAAGKAAALIYRLTDESTGAPVTDLEPFLGAWGHTLILSEDGERFLHSHPTQMLPATVDRAGLFGGPEVAFNATVRKPGVHRIWSQFLRRGKVTTVSFTIEAARLDHLAVWSGTAWTALGGTAAGGPDGAVRALATRGAELFAGGDFVSAGGEAASGVARWDGGRWRSLGSGVAGSVRALAVAGPSLYAGGEFTTAGGIAAGGIARWDGSRWSSLSSGVAGSRDGLRPAAVYAIAVRGAEVYVGGRFRTAGGVAAEGIARWDGTRFTPLGGGVRSGDNDGIVWALAFFKGELYVGGQFLSAGGVPARNVARWDGRAFHALGDGVTGGLERVSALAGAGDMLMVGGDFTSAGAAGAQQLALWDGAHWKSAGVRTAESVRAMASAGPDVFVAGGAFAVTADAKTSGIVRWNGNAWSALGNGLGSGAFLAPVLAIAPAGRVVYVGGGPFIVR